jgi:hypothetical protein
MPTTFQMRELGRDYELGSERLVDANNIQPVVAFGQSIAYRLFAARTYVVMPSTMGEEDQSRLEALCLLLEWDSCCSTRRRMTRDLSPS